MKPFLPFALALLATACSAVVPSTAARLATMDPLTADPAALELVILLPPGLAVVPGSARLAFGATRGAETRSGSFALEDRPLPAGITPPTGATPLALALTAADADRMRALQADIAEWKREGGAKGSLGLGLGGCAIGVGPAHDAVGTVLIRLVDGGPFLPLIREGKLADLLGPEVLAAIEPCKGAE